MSISDDSRQDGMADTDRIDALAAEIAAALPDLDPALQQAALTLLRLLAQWEPIDVQRLAEALALPVADVDQTLERSPGAFRDDHGRIVGFMGLSVAPISDHRLQIDGQSLWVWSAWDTLFCPSCMARPPASAPAARAPAQRSP
jgi:alkylmercury lyase